jgi:hypothetical protein
MANEITHYAGFTIRVVGAGNLRPTLKGFDDIETSALEPLVMASTNAREPTRLANFVSQRAVLRLETTAIDEWFKINNFTIWAKPLYTSFPG